MPPEIWEKVFAGLIGALIAAPVSARLAWVYKGKELDRVELRARLASLENDVRSLRDKAMIYWGRDGNDEKAQDIAREIKAKERQLGQEIRSVYSMKKISNADIDRLRSALRQEVTSGDFDGANRRKSEIKCDMISDKAGFMVEQLRRDFGIV